MAIKLIINGYHRSGTTFLWRYFKKALKDYTIFFEPLKHELAHEIREEEIKKLKDPLQSIFLWPEYNNLNELQRYKILRNHPSTNKFGIYNENAIINYLDKFNEISGKIALQTNRLQFFLDVPKKRYNAKTIHIIRQPLDVFESMLVAYNKEPKRALDYGKNPSKSRYIIRTIGKKVLPLERSMFEIDKDYKWILGHLGRPHNYKETLKSKYMQKIFHKFVLVWTISNYFAIKQIKKNKGYLVIYEDLIKNPKKVKDEIEKSQNLSLSEYPEVKKSNYNKFDPKKLIKLTKVVNELGIKEEFDFIIKEVKKKGFNYLDPKY